MNELQNKLQELLNLAKQEHGVKVKNQCSCGCEADGIIYLQGKVDGIKAAIFATAEYVNESE